MVNRKWLSALMALVLLICGTAWAEPALPEEDAEAAVAAAEAESPVEAEPVGIEEITDELTPFELDDATAEIADGLEDADEAPEAEPVESEDVALTPETSGTAEAPVLPSVELSVGDSGAVAPAEAAEPVHFESLDPAIATVDPASGQVTAVGEGIAIVQAVTMSGKVYESQVSVLPKPDSFTLKDTSVTLMIGETYQPELITAPENASKEYKLKVKNKKVAAVRDGVITGKRKGKTTVTVTGANGKKAKLSVRVLGAPKQIHMNRHSMYLSAGETGTATYTLFEGKTFVTFSSSDPAVATVDETSGLVTAVSQGVATVTARTLNGKTDVCQVYVDTNGSILPEGQLEITFMNVGRNDGILICCDGEYAYIDSGLHQQGVLVKKYLRKRGIYHLKYYIASHGHRDHIGGAGAIMEAVDVDEVLMPTTACASRIVAWSRGAAERMVTRAAKYRVLKVDEVVTLGSATLTCLGPIRTVKASASSGEENHNSLVLRLVHGENSFLLTGDAMGSEQVDIQKHNPGCMKSTVLKNPHHDGIHKYAVKQCDPQIVVFSTSRSKQPPASYVSWIKRRGAQVYVTSPNRHGNVTMISDGKTLTVTTQKTLKK